MPAEKKNCTVLTMQQTVPLNYLALTSCAALLLRRERSAKGDIDLGFVTAKLTAHAFAFLPFCAR